MAPIQNQLLLMKPSINSMPTIFPSHPCKIYKNPFMATMPLSLCDDENEIPNFTVIPNLEQEQSQLPMPPENKRATPIPEKLQMDYITLPPEIMENQQVTPPHVRYVTIPENIYRKSRLEKYKIHQAQPPVAEIEPITVMDELEVGVDNDANPTTAESTGNDDDPCYINDSRQRCCSVELENNMNQAFNNWQETTNGNPSTDCNGNLVNVIQQSVQAQFGMSFEIIVSSAAVAIKSSYEGNFTCGISRNGKNIQAFGTPVQYDLSNVAVENALEMADVSNPSTCETVYYDQRRAVVREMNGVLSGGGEGGGNGCRTNAGGYTCCNDDMDDAMRKGFEDWKSLYARCDKGNLVTYIQKAVQTKFRLSFEAIVSETYVAARPIYYGNLICGFLMEGKHVLAWANPNQYDLSNTAHERALGMADISHPDVESGWSGCEPPPPTFKGALITQMNALLGFSPFKCFSGDTEIVLANGKKIKMMDLKIDDWIVGMENGKLVAAKVKNWIHKKTSEMAEFLIFNLENGKTLKVTDDHFIFKTNCFDTIKNADYQKIMIPAKNLKIGDCLIEWNGSIDNTNFTFTKIIFINKTIEKGFYAPNTSSGNLFVNGILASCYSNINFERIFYVHDYILNFITENIFAIIIDQWPRSSKNQEISFSSGSNC